MSPAPDVETVADALEPKMALAFVRAVEQMRKLVPINALAMALHAKDTRAALAFLPKVAVMEMLAPAATIARETTLRGGLIGAAEVNEALR